MKYSKIKAFTLIIFTSLLSFGVSAASLQDLFNGTGAASITMNDDLIHIIELVVAGIIASALTLSILVFFLGSWTGAREKKEINAIRKVAEKEKNNVISSASTVKERERETTQLVQNIKDQADNLVVNKRMITKHELEIIETSKHVKAQSQQIDHMTKSVSNHLEEIQEHWDSQLSKTISTIQQLQENLDASLSKVDDDLEKMQRQKSLSHELLQDFLSRHHEQSGLLSSNTEKSEKVGKSLDDTFSESQQLIHLLKRHQESAEKSLKTFTEELTVYEEQAYEQFDTSFQVADIARQELDANIKESRNYIETMRRHEEQSHNINVQTHKNLESLDYAKITRLSNTINSTQHMFTDMQDKIEETQGILDKLKELETDIKTTTNNIEVNVERKKTTNASTDQSESNTGSTNEDSYQKSYDSTEYKFASGDNTPISFFKNVKKGTKKSR